MKKILLPIMILCTAVSANAVVRLFTGGELGAENPGNNISDVANYKLFSGDTNVTWSTISLIFAEGDVSEVTAFDKSFNWFGYGDFEYTPTGGTKQKYSVPKTLVVATSIDTRNQSVFCYSEENAEINILLGSKNAEEDTLKFVTAAHRFTSSSTSVTNIIKASDAAQTRFEIHTSDNPVNVRRGTVNYGTLETGAIDYMKIQKFEVAGGSLSVYADKIDITNPAATSTFASGSEFTLILSENGISDIDATVNSKGKFNLSEGASFNIDFSAFDEIYDDTLVLIQALDFEGFDSENLNDIIGVKGLEEMGKEWDFNIVNVGDYKQLQITISTVPEPSTVAAILGAIALGFVAYRRRK